MGHKIACCRPGLKIEDETFYIRGDTVTDRYQSLSKIKIESHSITISIRRVSALREEILMGMGCVQLTRLCIKLPAFYSLLTSCCYVHRLNCRRRHRQCTMSDSACCRRLLLAAILMTSHPVCLTATSDDGRNYFYFYSSTTTTSDESSRGPGLYAMADPGAADWPTPPRLIKIDPANQGCEDGGNGEDDNSMILKSLSFDKSTGYVLLQEQSGSDTQTFSVRTLNTCPELYADNNKSDSNSPPDCSVKRQYRIFDGAILQPASNKVGSIAY